MASSVIIDSLKKAHILELLADGKRLDGRSLEQPRELSIDVGVIPKAEGSARARLGDTEVVAGVKVQPERPFPDTGDQGMLICTAEILPIAHPTAETSPPTPDVVELARVTDRGIRESKMLDMTQLVLEKHKSVIGIFCDGICLLVSTLFIFLKIRFPLESTLSFSINLRFLFDFRYTQIAPQVPLIIFFNNFM